MRPERPPSDTAAVAHTALSLENYAQIYACIHQMKNKQIQLADAKRNPLMTRKNLSEVLKLRGLSSGKHAKPAILERLELLNIFNPHRSSTNPDDLESDLTMEEMEQDLEALGWIDCHLQSANVMEASSEHYVPVPLMIAEEAPICSSQHLMSIHSDSPSTMSHYVPVPLMIAEEAPICSSQHLMYIHSDTPSTMSHYVPVPLMIAEEAPICSSQHLMSIHSDTPSTMSMQTTVADNLGKALIRKKNEKKIRKLQEVYGGVCTGMDFVKSRTQGTGEIQDD